ncbi:MAG: TauD/TfdA family dioxygenase [Pseudomonadota bacterium]
MSQSEVRWADGETQYLSNLWLRDNCPCATCRVPGIGEKTFMVSGVPLDIAPLEIQVNGDQLVALWPDGHRSEYTRHDLKGQDEVVAQITLWAGEFGPPRYCFNDFLAKDNLAAPAIERFLKFGAIVLTDAPTTPDSVEQLSQRLGPIREVIFDRIHNVVAKAHGYNVAFTNLPLPPHCDLASLTWPPSAQALYMLANEAKGGDSILVDGWYVAQRIRETHPEYFDVLCRVSVPFRIFDGDKETFAVEPIIRLNTHGDLVQFRYSNQTMLAIDPSHPLLDEFYCAYHHLTSMIMSESNQARFRLDAGQVLLVAGHRVLHGRDSFQLTGRRHLQDAYFDHDNIRNHLRVLQRKLANA